ncbi:MAG: ADP-ribosylglycohydrolase family protein [Muribaculaceae bacterium]|nr:ADP-ribosylglycohydrolase family protein [Muribaculaceae bacterium]
MKRNFIPLLAVLAVTVLSSCGNRQETVEIAKDVMLDKVKGAWAGKMIGVMYGRPMEFMCTDTTYNDSIKWQPENVTAALNEDDIYGQLNFMSTMEKCGQDVSIDTLAKNFAYAEFALCHANLQARKNYFDGIPAAELSTPANSIHCEDIDFQIECDFIGFVNPCMPQSSNKMCEKVGAIMSAADGMYAGMYVSAMHTLAYSCSDIDSIVSRALSAIPAESGYAQCVREVIEQHKADPDNWEAAWKHFHEKWAPYDICTPYLPFNIDAKLNGAYVVMGLLYGDGDWFKTMEITIRCGQDTDCNTATAAAVLGIISGYEAIPEVLKSHIPAIADECFAFTDYSYNKAVSQTMAFIDENVDKGGGDVTDNVYLIKAQQPVAPAFVKGFNGIEVASLVSITDTDKWKFAGDWTDFAYGNGDDAPYKVSNAQGDVAEIEFDGTGVAVMGSWNTDGGRADVYIDDKFVKTVDTYYVAEAGKYEGNRAYLFYTIDLPSGHHKLKLVNSAERNPRSSGNKLYVEKILAYK